MNFVFAFLQPIWGPMGIQRYTRLPETKMGTPLSMVRLQAAALHDGNYCLKSSDRFPAKKEQHSSNEEPDTTNNPRIPVEKYDKTDAAQRTNAWDP